MAFGKKTKKRISKNKNTLNFYSFRQKIKKSLKKQKKIKKV